MNSKNSVISSGASLSSRLSSRVVASLWSTMAVAIAAITVAAQSLGYRATELVSQTNHCGPIDDTISYLIWLLRQL